MSPRRLTLALLLTPGLLHPAPGPAQIFAPTPSASADLAPPLHELALNHLAQAEQLVLRQIQLAPASPDARFLLGLILFREGRPKDSLAAYTAGAGLRTPSAADLATVASDYILLKDLPDAEKWLRYALTLTPADPHLWYLLGRTQYNEDRNADAVASLQHALRLAPPNSPQALRAQYNLGLAFERLGRPADAIAAYRAAIAAQANQPEQDPQPFLDLGTLLLAQNHPADALPLLDQAARLGPDNPLVFQQQGLALEALNRLPEAVTALQRAAALAPDSEQPHFFLARILRRLGRTSEANTEYAIVARLLGTHSSVPTPNRDEPATGAATQKH